MARSSQGPRSTTAWEPPKPPAGARIVRMGRPANDNGMSTSTLVRSIGLALSAAVVLYGLIWLGVI